MRWVALWGNWNEISRFPHLIQDGIVTDVEYDTNLLSEIGIVNIYQDIPNLLEPSKLFLFSPDSKRFAYIKYINLPYETGNHAILNIDWKDLYKETPTWRKIEAFAKNKFFYDDSIKKTYKDEIIYKWVYSTITDVSFSENSKDLYYIWESLDENWEQEFLKNWEIIKSKASLNKYVYSRFELEQKNIESSSTTRDDLYTIFNTKNSFWIYFWDTGMSSDWKSYIGEISDLFFGARLREVWEKKVCKISISFTEWMMIFFDENKYFFIIVFWILFVIAYRSRESESTESYWNNLSWIKPYTNPEYQLKIQKEREAQKLEEEKRRQEEEEKKRREIINRRMKFVPEAYMKVFLQHAERKYGKKDKYGNQDKDSLDKEINEYLIMISKQRKDKCEQNSVDAYIRGRHYPQLNDDYRWLISYLRSKFQEYHQERIDRLEAGEVDISKMRGLEFERYLAKLFEKCGYQVHLTSESGDQWADIIAEKHNNKIVIQAKGYSWSVGNGAIQEVIWAIKYYDGDEWWVITNSIFTNSAKELSRINNIKLIDGDSLRELEDKL